MSENSWDGVPRPTTAPTTAYIAANRTADSSGSSAISGGTTQKSVDGCDSVQCVTVTGTRSRELGTTQSESVAWFGLFHRNSDDYGNYWPRRFEFLIEGYKKSNPLEMKLFKTYLSTVPDWLKDNKDSSAYIFYGFEDFAKIGALGYAISATASFEGSTLFSRSFNPLSLKETAGLPSLFQEALQLQLNGPAIITRTGHDIIYGPPSHSWESFSPGWQPPKVEKK